MNVIDPRWALELAPAETSPLAQRRGTRPGRRWGALLAIALCSLALVGLVLLASRMLAPDTPAGRPAALGGAGRAGPAFLGARLPTVEPLVLVDDLPPDRARAINARIPFAPGGIVPASAFVFSGTAQARERAIGCLAAAALYEAGDDRLGQQAVAQVVLNRVRHAAFPKSVCGVVFQGSERATGCQFTFTCDGALARPPNPAALQRARAVAMQALDGAVDPEVGLATHYHTDWVVPYWSGRLEKIARVHTHLFFRWPGRWGRPAAFAGAQTGQEPIEPRIAAYFAAHGADAATATAAEEPMMASVAEMFAAGIGAAAGADPGVDPGVGADEAALAFAPTASNHDVFLATLPRSLPTQHYVAAAERACGARKRCVFMAWSSAALTPAGLPATTSQLESMTFHYIRDPALPSARVRWNCSSLAAGDRAGCLSHQVG